MKGWRIALLAGLALVFMAFCPVLAERGSPEPGIMRFPIDLRVIEEGAFENTAARELYFQAKLTRIGDRAFADMPCLRAAYIPPTVTDIADDAFRSDGRVTLYGVGGSPIEDWARNHGFAFIERDVWGLAPAGPSPERRAAPMPGRGVAPRALPGLLLVALLMQLALPPKERPEMYPIDYDFP